MDSLSGTSQPNLEIVAIELDGKMITASESALLAIAIAISFFSIALAFATFLLQRRHFIRSVRPIGFLWLVDQKGKVSIRFQNNGLGPLLIRDLKVTTPGNKSYTNLIDLMPQPTLKQRYSDYIGRPIGWSVRAGCEITLLEVEGRESDESFTEFREQVRSVLSALTISIDYEDIYGKKQLPVTKNLDWYARVHLK